MNWLKTHEPDFWLLRIALFFMLVFPAFYSPFTDVYQSAYYAGFSWAYFFLVLYLVLQLVRNKEKLWPLNAVGIMFFGILFSYNLLSLYFNHKYLHWYWNKLTIRLPFF